MIITCPSCETKFNLPDEMARKGAQLRCSVCKHVFGVPDTGGQMPGQGPEPAPGQTAPQPAQAADRIAPPREEPDDREYLQDEGESFALEEDADGGLSLDGDSGASSRARRGAAKSGKGCLVAGILIVLLLIGGGAAAWIFAGDVIRSYLPFGFGQASSAPAKDMISRITFRGVRQYTLANEKIGSIIVIEGKAVNGFDEPRELIRIEASLFDKDGKLLDKKQQMAGTSVSLFQLQVLGEKELEQALGNRIEILSNNTNVPPGGEVPFMIVFYKPSEAVTEFGVTVTEAKVPPKK